MSGDSSDFEQEYTLKFQTLALNYGEFLTYNRDQSHIDIGLHLKKKLKDGSKSASSIVFFQLKGKKASTISKGEIEARREIVLQVEVPHLQQWHKYSSHTYLTVYLEAIDRFYYINIKSWVERTFGPKILDKTEATTTVKIPIVDENILDESAFEKLFNNGEILGWKNLVGDLLIKGFDDDQHRSLFEDCLYTHNLIRKIAEIEEEGGSVEVQMIDWQSKTRGEVHFFDPRDSTPVSKSKSVISRFDAREPLHSRWQYMLSIAELESEYPYLDFAQDEDEYYRLDELYEDPYGYGISVPKIEFKNGSEAIGEEASGELIEYKLIAKLNKIGQQVILWLDRMEKAAIIDPSEDCSFVSRAPWHRKEC